MSRTTTAVALALGLALTAAPSLQAAKAPATWDNLVQVKAKNVDLAYVAPGVDFSGYTKVMLDPTEVAFQKNWVRDYNDQTLDLSSRISDSDAKKMMDKVRTGFEQIFTQAFQGAGYQVVTEPGPDVLRLRTGVIDLYVSAPDRMTSARNRNFAREAGGATLFIEARDSVSGALLGRAVDKRLAGDTGPYLRNSVTNRSDFERLFKDWAKASVNGLNTLKAQGKTAGA